MAYIQQESVLFSTTIFDNIAFGLTDRENVSQDDVQTLVTDAAKVAHAHDFISALPQGYDTEVGEKGLMLSGGQRQRIAIARAVIRSPKILLLDEATAGLDSLSEQTVQRALDTALQGRTTIVITHNLSTIQHADNIVVLSGGVVVEQGNHETLLAEGGVYAKMTETQRNSGQETAPTAAETRSESVVDEERSDSVTKFTLPSSQSLEMEHDVETAEPGKANPLSFMQLMKLIVRLIDNPGVAMAGLLCSIAVGAVTPL